MVRSMKNLLYYDKGIASVDIDDLCSLFSEESSHSGLIKIQNFLNQYKICLYGRDSNGVFFLGLTKGLDHVVEFTINLERYSKEYYESIFRTCYPFCEYNEFILVNGFSKV